RRVLFRSPILVIADCRVDLPLWREVVSHVTEYRPGIVVLAIREECLIGVGRKRVDGIEQWLVVDGGNSESPVGQVTGGNETLGMDEPGTADPRETCHRRRGEAQLLTPGLDIDELALTLIERAAQGSRCCSRERIS